MKYEAWSWKAIEGRIIEMADTLRLSPSVKGPQEFGNAMPEPVREHGEGYGYGAAYYRESASASSLSRMYAVWEWINSLPEQSDRKLIYSWSWVKVRKGMKISAFAAQNDLNDRMLRREITRICHAIAEQLNRDCQPRLNSEDCTASENQTEHGQSDVTYQTCATHWIAPGAKPIYDPYSPELAALIVRLEKANEQREQREARRRKKMAAYEAQAVLNGNAAA